jgi:hypothetical protein
MMIGSTTEKMTIEQCIEVLEHLRDITVKDINERNGWPMTDNNLSQLFVLQRERNILDAITMMIKGEPSMMLKYLKEKEKE